MHGPEPFITIPYTSCVSTVKNWSTDRWKSMWNKLKECLRMKESVGWTSSRLTVCLLNLMRLQLNRVVQVLTGRCYLQRYKKTAGRAESSLCPKCSLENETPNHQVGNCKLYKDIRVKCFGITKTTVHDVATKCQRWSPRRRPWPRGHILKSLALASKPQIFENYPVLSSRIALFLNS